MRDKGGFRWDLHNNMNLGAVCSWKRCRSAGARELFWSWFYKDGVPNVLGLGFRDF